MWSWVAQTKDYVIVMSEADPRILRRRRGVAKASITRLDTRVSTLEGATDQPKAKDSATQLLKKLNEASSEFKKAHLSLIDLIDDEETLKEEQIVLDEHDDTVESLAVRLQVLIASSDAPTQADDRRILSRRLKQLQNSFKRASEEIEALGEETVDFCHLKQHNERLRDYKKDLADVNSRLLLLELEDSDELLTQHVQLEKTLFDCALKVKKLTEAHSSTADEATHLSESKGIKLPKLEVPVFNGSLLHWRSFWEQFEVSIHKRSNLSNSEKLVYLQQALKGGSAKSTIEGLSKSGDNYKEAIQCLKARYDRPRLIHQAHVKTILEAAPLKDGSGKEIRKLHDTVLQHLRALKSMGYEPSGPFITSALELKLDQNTMFEWQKYSQESDSIPHYRDLLAFLNLRAQATESSLVDHSNKKAKIDSQPGKRTSTSGAIFSYTSNAESSSSHCIVCKSEKHPLYACPRFKDMPHDTKVSTLKTNNLCMNCLGANHYVRRCKSMHRCKHCQRQHHTLLHVDNVSSTPATIVPQNQFASNPMHTVANQPIGSQSASPVQIVLDPRNAYQPIGAQNVNPAHVLLTPQNQTQSPMIASQPNVSSTPVSVALHDDMIISNTAIKLKSNSLLMTCRILVSAPDGTSVEARALLDNASSASFMSERLAQSLSLPRAKQKAHISGIAGITHSSSNQSLVNFNISSVKHPQTQFNVTAVVVPRVTCDLPFQPVTFKAEWSHLNDLELADPGFGHPGRIDVLLGVDVFVAVLCHGRRNGPPGTPIAFETQLGWVLAGSTETCVPSNQIATLHASCLAGDDVLRKFWEMEESPLSEVSLTPEERSAVKHFKSNYRRTESGRFIVPLPKRDTVKSLGESRSLTVRRFLSLERTLHSRNQFDEVEEVIKEYLDLNHAELIPLNDLDKPTHEVFYLPMHVVRKESSTTTKLRAVFDASMKTTSGVSLNDMLMVGPTVHPQLIDVLLQFRMHRIALVADISKMYRAVELPTPDRDLHRFVWRASPNDVLRDYRMTRVTFGVASSSFIASMSVKQNAADFAHKYPLATKVVDEGFYVDDCLTGANSVEESIELQRQLRELFSEADFLLRKWNSSNPTVLQSIPPDLRDTQNSLTISSSDGVYTKTLGIEWHSVLDHFRLSVTDHVPSDNMTKRLLVSDIAKTYDVLGWFSPTIIKSKILLQKVWEAKIDWDDCVPQPILGEWLLWRSQLKALSQVHIPRCYYPKEVKIVSTQLHGFSDASESAFAGVVYLRMTDSEGNVHVSLVTSKTKVAPIKRITIPRLELCGAHLLTKLLEHVRSTLKIPIEDVYAWTDSTIVINWLDGNPRRFKTYVGNRISFILDRIPPSRWSHVPGEVNPADCASRGLLPLELVEHEIWWNGPTWLRLSSRDWPRLAVIPDEATDEQREICLLTTVDTKDPLMQVSHYSSYTKLIRVTAWVMRFIANCRTSSESRMFSPLNVPEIVKAENYWLSYSQRACFAPEIAALLSKSALSSNSDLIKLSPFVDSNSLLRISGREQNSQLSYAAMHPVILHGKHYITKLIIRAEHVRLLHAGPTLLTSTLNCKFHIIGGRKSVRSVTRSCVTCRRQSVKPKPQKMGQLPLERVTPDLVFENVGVDYAGPISIKYGYVRKPTVVKAYICVFVSLSIKAVHLELVSDLTTDAFVSALRRFIARRGKPKLIWSDHGTNFVGAQKELKQLSEFLENQKVQNLISQFCVTQRIQWKFIPERAPHFGGLWESTVKSMKYHLKRITANVKLTFEECSTVLAQVEACLNSRPIVALPCNEDGVGALTPGHFLIGRPIESLPDPSFSYRSFSMLRRWHLCQNLTRQFWQRWSQEYLASLRKMLSGAIQQRIFQLEMLLSYMKPIWCGLGGLLEE